MINRLRLILIFKFEIILQCLSKKLILLPYNSELCNSSINGINKFQEFTINQQLNIGTASDTSDVLRSVNDYNNNMNATETSLYLPWHQTDSDKSQYYFCRVLVKPMGRQLEAHTEQGEYSFWNIRARIGRLQSPNFSSVVNCSDRLLLQFRHKHNLISTLESHSAQSINITCKDSLPIIIPSSIRKLYITYFSTNPNSEGFTINVTTFIYFQGDFSISFQKETCRRQDGFWCGNNTNACIYRDLICDRSDSCFDGGSDEMYCPSFGNMSLDRNMTQVTRTKGTFIDYLPWLALAILPLILLMALVCICNQHRSEVFFDDEEDNLDVEKSQEENADHMWSSLDALDQLDKTANDKEENENNCEEDGRLMHLTGKEPLIGLQTINCSATVKAEITTSCTGNSLNKDYEDIDKPIIIANGESGSTNLPASNSTKDFELQEKRPDLPQMEFLTNSASNVMTISQITDDDYVLEDVGSLLRKVDKSKIPEELRINSIATTAPPEGESSNPLMEETAIDYRSDYILV